MEYPYDLLLSGAAILIASVVLGYKFRGSMKAYCELHDITILEEESDIGGILKTYSDYKTQIRRDVRTGEIELFARVWKKPWFGNYYADGKWRKLNDKEQKEIHDQLFDKEELKLILED
jgi:hypothetical protein